MDEEFVGISTVYEEMSKQLGLVEQHQKRLESRGFSDEEIVQGGYSSLSARRKTVIAQLEKQKANLSGVPGFWVDNKKPKLAGQSGLLIPVRNFYNQIVGMKIRSDKDNIAAKYTQLSSNPKPDKEGNTKYPGGTAAKTHIHYPIFKKPDGPIKTVRITEGELKADIASSASDVYTISIPGVNMWQWALDAIEQLGATEVYLAFDSDKDKEFSSSTPQAKQPFEVARALASLYMGAKEKGYDTKIEHWDGEYGKGIDDVLVGGHSDKIRFMTDDECNQFCAKALKGKMPLEWLYIIGTKRFINPRTFQELDKEQFSDKFAPDFKKEKAADAVIKHPGFPKVDNPIYLPGQPPLIERGELKHFNFWTDCGAKSEEGDIDPFTAHAELILPDETERNIMLDWMAYNVQQPGKKIHWALLIQGVQGTGKSFFGEAMRLVLGKKNVSNPSNEAIHEPYTGWQKSCQLVVVEEMMARGRLELMNKLKPMITQDIAVIRDMYKPAYEQPNCFNLFLFTNYKDAIILDDDDRRYGVLFSSAVPKDAQYYEELFGWLEKNAGKVRKFLEDRDISNFKAKGHAPMTEGKKVLIGESLMPLEQWIRDGIEDSAWPFHGDLLATRHLMGCLPHRLGRVSETIVARALAKMGCQKVGRVKLNTDGYVRLWSLRRHEMYGSAESTFLANEYEKWSAEKEPGGNPLKDAEPI